MMFENLASVMTLGVIIILPSAIFLWRQFYS